MSSTAACRLTSACTCRISCRKLAHAALVAFFATAAFSIRFQVVELLHAVIDHRLVVGAEVKLASPYFCEMPTDFSAKLALAPDETFDL